MKSFTLRSDTVTHTELHFYFFQSFAELESLKGLPLHKNRFTTIPSSVFALVNLEELYVCGGWRVESREGWRQERGRRGGCAVVVVVLRTFLSYCVLVYELYVQGTPLRCPCVALALPPYPAVRAVTVYTL